MMRVRLPQRAWFGDIEIEIEFPGDWNVSVHGMAADERPLLSDDQIRELIGSPIGSPPLRKLARGCKEIAIIFDDLTRPTPVSRVLPFVLEELSAAGIEDEQIRLIAALGAHGAHTRIDFEKKLGPEVLRRFRVYNHNPYENCTDMGTTERGTPVSINSEAAACDLMVAIGSILPHPFMGFGGGGKIVFPGIASMDSIQANHMLAGIQLLGAGLSPVDGLGRFDDNEARLDVAEAAKLAGLNFIVNLLLNSRRGIIGLVAGDHIEAYHAGVREAQQLYGTPKAEGADVVVVNANAKASEAAIAVLFAAQSLKEEGGELVVVVDSPIGQMTHYLLGAFGKETGGRLWNRQGYLPERVNRVIALSSYPDRAGGDWFAPAEKLTWAAGWEEVLGLLREKHGPGTRAAVYIDGTMQFYRQEG
jgi:nickel-dependent lactate racemase